MPSASPIDGLSAVGLLGGGVIGGGWAARFLLNGVDVKVFDPEPQAPRKVEEIMANARRACGRLTMAPLPPEGTLTFVQRPEAAAEGVDFVQESAPERVDLKRELLAAASTAAPPSVVFASSTSGLLPSHLQADMTHPERLVVGHPFNPVYLLPLVEVVGGRVSLVDRRSHARLTSTPRSACGPSPSPTRSTASWPIAFSRLCGARRCGS